jgi:hypothetical protein
MATKQELEKKWKPILKWLPEFRQAQTKVLAEEGVWVPLIRMCSHCGIETGYTGDPNIVSRGTNSDSGTGCHRDGRCSPDLKAHGLFQIFWPPFKGVNWSNVNDPAYNSYLGAKVLAQRYKECGSWRAASMAFFAGSCVDLGVIDHSTGTDQKTYDAAMTKNMAELEQLNVGVENDDPKSQPTDGSKNTPTDKPECKTILGKEFCLPNLSLDPSVILQGVIEQYLPRIVMVAIGILLLAIGVWSIT